LIAGVLLVVLGMAPALAQNDRPAGQAAVDGAAQGDGSVEGTTEGADGAPTQAEEIGDGVYQLAPEPAEAEAETEALEANAEPAGDGEEVTVTPYPILAPPGGKPTFVMAVPNSGHWATFGIDAAMGAELALKTIGGGFELKTIDEAAPDFAYRLRSLGSPVAIMGHLYESRLSQGAPYYAKAGAPILLTYIESQKTSELGPAFVRLLPDPASQGRRLAKEVPRTGKRIKQVYVLEGPEPGQKELAEAFREALINPQAPPPTKANPKPSKPRALKATSVNTIPVDKPEDLNVLLEIKGSPQDWILVALPPRLAMRAAPVLASSGFKRATFLIPTSLAIREIGASFLAVDIKNAQVAVPLEFGSGKTLNKALSEFRRRFIQYHRREPSWAAVMAYDAATLAGLAASSEEGALPYLGDAETVHVGVAGRLTLSEDGWPLSAIKLDPERLHWLP
jgi:ABC-type branched-subunit amino acid transport system substrate-binding protein